MLEVVTGAPFSGTGRWIAAQVDNREAAGELGVVAINYTDIYAAISPGANSQYRDDAVSETGVPRLAGYLYAAAVREAAARELSGYVDDRLRALQLPLPPAVLRLELSHPRVDGARRWTPAAPAHLPQGARLTLPPPVRQERRVQPLATQQGAHLAGLLARRRRP